MEAVDRSDDRHGQEVAAALQDTIFALSSGAPPAAIAIVRVSGPAAAGALEAVTGRLPEARRASHAAVRAADGSLIDRALLLWMPGPASATGEDLVEFHLHGGRAVVAALLERLSGLVGLRPALPGEFTRRAFLNGRIDLTAAEGLADLLEAETADQHRQALRMAEGGLGRVIERWRGDLLGIAAQIEAAIEFGESDEEVGSAPPDLERELRAIADEAERLLDAPPAERLRDGLRIVAAGPPNTGKSSLINILAGRDVALSTPVAGTTRDVIEAPVHLDGHALLLTDTAGLREEAGEIEQLGIVRAHAAIEAADLILWCGAPAACPDMSRSLLLHTRADMRADAAPAGSLAVSQQDPASIGLLRRSIEERCRALQRGGDGLSLNLRQRGLVSRIREDLRHAGQQRDLVLQAEHVRLALIQIDALTGRGGVEAMLDQLFGRFCLGK